MTDLKQENATYRETLAQFQGKMDTFQGNMDTILEYFQAQKATTSTSADPVTVVVTYAIVVVTSYADAIVETMIQSVVSQRSVIRVLVGTLLPIPGGCLRILLSRLLMAMLLCHINRLLYILPMRILVSILGA